MLQNLVIGVGPPSLDGEVGSSAIMIPVGSAPSSFRIPIANLDKSDSRYSRSDILALRALPAGRITGLGARRDFHHGVLKPDAAYDTRGPRNNRGHHADDGDQEACPSVIAVGFQRRVRRISQPDVGDRSALDPDRAHQSSLHGPSGRRLTPS